VQPRLVRIPRHLLHVGLDDLPGLGIPESTRDALRELLADLPLVPDASASAQLIGPPTTTLACLAVLARHVGQGLRDRNLSMAHDRERLHVERAKLVFVNAEVLAEAVARGDDRPRHEAVLFVSDLAPPHPAQGLLMDRHARGFATFVTAQAPLAQLAEWRLVDLTSETPS
jgi:hypothetical protein